MADLGNDRNSVWMAVGLMAAGAACTTPPTAMETDGSSSGPSTGTTTGQTTEPTTGTTSTTSPTTGTATTTTTPLCQVNSDCPGECSFCTYYNYCYNPSYCPPECYYQDSSCPLGELCHEDECVEVAKIPTCERQTLELSAIPLQDNPDGLLLADLDGDGILDLVATEPATGMVEIALGDGAGNFAAGDLAMSGQMGDDDQHIAAADFDLDGDLDLVVLRSAPVGELSLLLGQDAMFMAPVTFTIGNAPHQIFAGLLDDDATPDVLVIEEAAFSVRTGDGMGSLNAEDATQSNAALGFAGPGDLDDDGTLEFAIPTTGDTVSLRRYDYGANGIALTDSLGGVGKTPFNAALIADLQGALTLVATRRVNGVGTISLWPADADANAEPTLDVAIPGGAFAVTAADFDGDGQNDLLVLKDSNSFDVRVVYFNADGPECVQSYEIDHWAAPARIAVADVDGDDKPDIVIGNPSGMSATLLRSGP